jgi:hypothetical protein
MFQTNVGEIRLVIGTRGTHDDASDVCSILVGKPEGGRPLGKPRRTCDDNIKMDV